MNPELSVDEIQYYTKMLKQAIDIVCYARGVVETDKYELVVAVFDKIASPLVYLRQDMKQEGNKAENPSQGEGKAKGATTGKKTIITAEDEALEKLPKEIQDAIRQGIARYESKGFKPSKKNPLLFYKKENGFVFFYDAVKMREWSIKEEEAKE